MNTVNNAFGWTPSSSSPNYNLGLPNTMLPNNQGGQFGRFNYRAPNSLGLTSSFQTTPQSQSSYQNIGRGPSVPSVSGWLSGGMGGNYTGNARGGSSGQRVGYEQGRPVAPQQQTQRPPRSFLGGLVGRDYHLLKGG